MAQTFDVRFASAGDLRDADERELRHGGCFVRATPVPAPFSAVVVTFHLPEGPPVDVSGRVVNVRQDGFFAMFVQKDEIEVLRSAIQFVLTVSLTPAPIELPEPAAPVVAPEPEPVVDPEKALPSGLKPAWELIDYGSEVPLHKQVSSLSVNDKLRLARHATRPVRTILIHDIEKRIHVEVIQNPKVAEEEIVEYTAMAGLSPLALRWIGSQRRYLRNPAIVMNLVQNAGTPQDLALQLVATLNQTDLLKVSRSTRVRETVSRAAKKKLMDAGVI